MGDFNSERNRVVWVDVPVDDLDRAVGFYAAVLGVAVGKEQFGEYRFAVFDHEGGNGGCLVPRTGEGSTGGGPLVYFNADGRIRSAVAEAEAAGGRIVEPITSIGPHGFRAIVIDTEGNRVALHSRNDA